MCEHPLFRISKLTSRYDAVRLLVGLLLVVTAGLKAHGMVTKSMADAGFFGSRWFLVALVDFELALGLSLLFGLWRSTTRYISIATFLIFAFFSFYRGLSGKASCACFGQIRIAPWWTLTIDAVCAIALITSHPAPMRVPDRRAPLLTFGSRATRPFELIVIALIVLIEIGTHVLLTKAAPHLTSDTGFAITSSGAIILEPTQWVGQQCPLLPYLSNAEEASIGDWIVLLYRGDCNRCRLTLPSYCSLAGRLAASESTTRVALIEVDGSNALPRDSCPSAVIGKLETSRRWIVTTPLPLLLKDGIVVSVLGLLDQPTPKPSRDMHLNTTILQIPMRAASKKRGALARFAHPVALWHTTQTVGGQWSRAASLQAARNGRFF